MVPYLLVSPAIAQFIRRVAVVAGATPVQDDDARSVISIADSTDEEVPAPAAVPAPEDTVECEWNYCGMLVSARTLEGHIHKHGIEIPSRVVIPRECLWAGCTATPTNRIRSHARAHYGRASTGPRCAACGDAFPAATPQFRMHVDTGACTKCDWCGKRFASVSETLVHVEGCIKQHVKHYPHRK
jgi:hypothetical protein